MAFDFKKEFKEYYAPGKKPTLVTIPSATFLAVTGRGDPNEPDGDYKSAIALLYGVAYTIKMSKLGKTHLPGYFDYVVPPLEGFWRAPTTTGLFVEDKSSLEWRSVIRTPEFVDANVLRWAREEAARKKDGDFARVELFTLEEGLCAQALHVGSYDDEPTTIAAIREFAQAQGYAFDLDGEQRHHEIYLSDPRRVAPEKLKTIIRIPIRPARRAS